jgi:transposase
MRVCARGGYTPAEQQRRQRPRLEAAGRFAHGDGINEIAHDLRVTPGSVRRWHRAWRDDGPETLKRSMVNFAAADLDGMVRIVKRKLKKTQYRPHLINGCLAATGL